MTQCDAHVVAVTSNNEVWVEVRARLTACEHCPNPMGCQTGLLGQANRPRRYRMSNTLDLRVGDRVRLVVAEGTVFRAVLASYVIPLLLIISGAMIGQRLAGDEAAAGGALVGLALGFALLRRCEQSFHDGHHPFYWQKLCKETTFPKKPLFYLRSKN